MDFCKCGGIIVSAGDKGKCRSCGKTTSVEVKAVKSVKKKEETVVIENNKPDLPETDVRCEKCGNMRAFWWLIQTRSADEPPTQFYKCTKCKHTWREYK